MERIRTIVRPIKGQKRIFYNVEDVVSSLEMPMVLFMKMWKEYKEEVSSQKRNGVFDEFEFFIKNHLIESIKGANGVREDLYCTFYLLQSVITIWKYYEKLEELF